MEKVINSNILGKLEKKNRRPKIVYIQDGFISNGDIGFLLSNGIMGVYFQTDKSSIILEYD